MPGEEALGRVGRRRRRLGGDHLAGVLVDRHDVGEGAAGVDADPDPARCHGTSLPAPSRQVVSVSARLLADASASRAERSARHRLVAGPAAAPLGARRGHEVGSARIIAAPQDLRCGRRRCRRARAATRSCQGCSVPTRSGRRSASRMTPLVATQNDSSPSSSWPPTTVWSIEVRTVLVGEWRMAEPHRSTEVGEGRAGVVGGRRTASPGAGNRCPGPSPRTDRAASTRSSGTGSHSCADIVRLSGAGPAPLIWFRRRRPGSRSNRSSSTNARASSPVSGGGPTGVAVTEVDVVDDGGGRRRRGRIRRRRCGGAGHRRARGRRPERGRPGREQRAAGQHGGGHRHQDRDPPSTRRWTRCRTADRRTADPSGTDGRTAPAASASRSCKVSCGLIASPSCRRRPCAGARCRRRAARPAGHGRG